ncbi:hypothetical protein PQ689_03265 [Thermoanaerobacterium thermosaccharolyticum]|uniref:hypothetical protein n=1 Tax=Thermoanaerobacterium thermosaccharolyticum TaxID=1517 RepID=UPI003D2D404E
MGRNTNRIPKNQIYHNNILKDLANDLFSKGYIVKADHINWAYGAPIQFNGHVPDLIAIGEDGGKFIMEVEDCTTYSDEHTEQQLKAFTKVQGYTCYIIVPAVCNRDDKAYNTQNEVRTLLNNWGLPHVKIGLYDWDSKKITYL